MKGVQYPDWHRQPLSLSRAEMEDPLAVFHQFFQFHSMTRTRAVLRRWLLEGLHADEEDAPYLVTHCEELIRLTEAAWLLYSKDISKKPADGQAVPKSAPKRNKRARTVKKGKPSRR